MQHGPNNVSRRVEDGRIVERVVVCSSTTQQQTRCGVSTQQLGSEQATAQQSESGRAMQHSLIQPPLAPTAVAIHAEQLPTPHLQRTRRRPGQSAGCPNRSTQSPKTPAGMGQHSTAQHARHGTSSKRHASAAFTTQSSSGSLELDTPAFPHCLFNIKRAGNLPRNCARPLRWPRRCPGASCQSAAPLPQPQARRSRCSTNRRTQARAGITQLARKPAKDITGRAASTRYGGCVNTSLPVRGLACIDISSTHFSEHG